MDIVFKLTTIFGASALVSQIIFWIVNLVRKSKLKIIGDDSF